MDFSKQAMLEAYSKLVAQRDEKNADVASLQDALDKANVEAHKAREKAEKLALAISEAKGGQEWLALKTNIATLARALGGRDGVLASK